MATDRFHKAARDSLLDVLKEATRRDCNLKDEDGMTPTLWAAFEGNLDALRLLVGRGGDPDKADHFGNTALHLSAARGHMNCVTFLANFGVNLWALDIDFHSAKELAAMNNRDEVLRFLDGSVAAEEAAKPKAAKAKRDKALKEAEKRLKALEKQHKKADRLAEKEQRRLKKQRSKMDEGPETTMPHRPSHVLAALKKAKAVDSAKFSDIVQGNGPKKNAAGVQKKLLSKTTDFKVTNGDGQRTVRSLSGLRRDSEVMYVGAFDKNGKTNGALNSANRTLSEPEYLHNDAMSEPASIFDRPGFGSVAFRNSITATLNALPTVRDGGKEELRNRRNSLGSAGSSNSRGRRQSVPWDDEDVESDDEDDAEWSPLQLFLLAHGLGEHVQTFINEQIDLEALMLLTDHDLVALGLPLGPRRKLLKALEDRRRALDEPGEVEDSQL
ncbi:pre-mRNA splicing regulator USH1G [Neocloeon triangulifer]|uniref:pre-mRNA splicing regulator USH1G n=1 Tax=Neocloeon triangulifer TaxID=2078957 RepID=UPI00286EB697|nr:pre-mRNA splicing regulator USH1G [Neocloeon triangulifer]